MNILTELAMNLDGLHMYVYIGKTEFGDKGSMFQNPDVLDGG